MEQEDFEVRKHMLKEKYNKCMVCLKKFKLGERVILCPIQKPLEGWANAMAIPIHTKCYWVGEGK